MLNSRLHGYKRTNIFTENIFDAKQVAVQAQDAPMSALSMKFRCGSIGTGPEPQVPKSENTKIGKTPSVH